MDNNYYLKKWTNTYHKLLQLLLVGTITMLAVSLQSCEDACEDTYSYTTSEPVYVSYEDFRVPITTGEAQVMETPGKLYFIAPYILVNERHKGIHIIDNSDPTNPINTAFIKIEGNVDMAVKNSVLYADSYTDLLAIDISDLNNVQLLKRVENVFAENFATHPELGFIVEYETVEHIETVKCGEEIPIHIDSSPPENSGGIFPTTTVDVAFNESSADQTSAANGPPNANANANAAPGIGGSMARFTLYNNYLYIVTSYQLQVYDISNNASPQAGESIPIGWEIETIFPFQGNLLIGSQFGMYIYSLDNPSVPAYVSEFNHIRSCDPVVAEGDYAYVTLRSGTPCQGAINQLDVLNISDIYSPELVASYPMKNPHGLGIDNSVLFICDGNDGLKVYDANDVEKIDQNQLAHYPDIFAFDVIPYNDILLMIGSDGLYQYNYSDEQNISLLSHIAVGN